MGASIMATSYLDEYRRKYGTLSSPIIKEKTPDKCESDLQKLLSRYLEAGNKRFSSPAVVVKRSDSLCLHSSSPAHNLDSQQSPSLAHREMIVTAALESTQLSDTLLPSGDEPSSRQTSLTVDQILSSDPKLAVIRESSSRRHSSPALPSPDNAQEVQRSNRTRRRKSSNSFKTPIHEAILDQTENNPMLRTSHILDPTAKRRVRRSSSTQSNRSTRSADLSTDGSDNVLLPGDNALSDEGSDFDSDIELNDSNLNDSDSQRFLTRFQLDNDSQRDIDSLASYEEGILCSHCSPGSPRITTCQELCARCSKHQTERRDTVQEVLDSEISYGKDLQVIHEEFHNKLQSAGLLDDQELTTIFGNISELIAVHQKLTKLLQLQLTDMSNRGDVSYSGVMLGQLFCESSASFLAFEKYCINFSDGCALIEQLKKERELFSLFLSVSQDDNVLLRRMDLKTFLMIPVQRVMRYPLLLKRLHKVTSIHHPDRNAIGEAVEKLSNILHHINSQSKLLTSLLTNSKNSTSNSKGHTSFEIALTKLTMDAVGWKHSEIHFVISGKVGYLQTTDSQWNDKIRNLRFIPAFAVLITHGKEDCNTKPMLFPSNTTQIQDAAIVIIRKGNSKLYMLREPFYLRNCIISRNAEFHDVFEIQETIRDSIVVRPVHTSEVWYQNIKYFSMVLGGRNQRRRNASANIVLHTK